MTYDNTTASEFRTKQGTLSEKITDEFSSLHNGGVKSVTVALTAGAAESFALAWQNPESTAILVQRVLVDLTTAGGTANSVLNVGSAANDTTTSNNVIDGLNLNTTGLFDNIDDQGTNGAATARLDAMGGTTDYLTGQILVATAADLVGNVYIEYVMVE